MYPFPAKPINYTVLSFRLLLWLLMFSFYASSIVISIIIIHNIGQYCCLSKSMINVIPVAVVLILPAAAVTCFNHVQRQPSKIHLHLATLKTTMDQISRAGFQVLIVRKGGGGWGVGGEGGGGVFVCFNHIGLQMCYNRNLHNLNDVNCVGN